MRQYWIAPIPPLHTADGAAYASSTSLTDVSPTPHIKLPANFLEIGSKVRLWAAGQFSNTSTPTLLLGFYYGAIAGSALAASSAITTTTGATAWPWNMEYRGTVRATGTSGSIQGQGVLRLGTALTSFTIRPIPEVAASRTVTIDTSVEKTITVGAQWGTNNASNTLTCTDLVVEVLS